MTVTDPFEQLGGQSRQGSMPPAQALPQAAPLGPNQPLPQAQPILPSQAVPQGMPVPVGQPTAARPIAVAVDKSPLKIHQRDPEEEPGEEISSVALKNSPPWLVSAVFHMIVLIILGLLITAINQGNQVSLSGVVAEEEEELEDIWAEKEGLQTEIDSPLAKEEFLIIEEPFLTPDNLPPVPDPFAAPPELEIRPDGEQLTSDLHANLGYALDGRQPGSRKGLLAMYGGNRSTEEAVMLGLEWLARQQLRQGEHSSGTKAAGSWSLAGPYTDAVLEDFDNPVAATAMALIAFQGDGHTHKKGRFRTNVSRGWSWLIKQQNDNGGFAWEYAPMNHRFYTHGQCTIALCELYGMTKDEKYKEAALRAVDYCVKTQSPEGGWRYEPGVNSDISVTGWIVMALQSARMAGLEVPRETLDRISAYLDSVGLDGGARYPYRKSQSTIKRSMTAEALLCRQYLGWKRDDPRMISGLDWITSPQNLVDFSQGRDVYYWYYATQAAHHMEGESWRRWNGVMRQVLPEQQVKRGGEAGSWDPERPSPDQWAPQGGRLFVTCLSIYMLEVYYRHLPIYTKIYSSLLKGDRVDGQ